MTHEDGPPAQAAIAAFLEKGVREGDYVSLLASSGESWWNTRMEGGRADLLAVLRRLEGRRLPDGRLDRLSDWEAMRIAQYNDTLVGERVYRRFQMLRLTEDAAFPASRVEQTRSQREEDTTLYGRGINEMMVETRAAETYRDVRERGTRALATLERALDSLLGAKGRKTLILVSDGFILDTALDGFKQVVQAARRSNVAIYFVNTRGLKGLGGALRGRHDRAGGATGHRGSDGRPHPGSGRRRAPGQRHRRPRCPEHQRPGGGHPAHRAGVHELLPPRL